MTRPDVPRGANLDLEGYRYVKFEVTATSEPQSTSVTISYPDFEPLPPRQSLMSRAWSKATGSCRAVMRALGRIGK